MSRIIEALARAVRAGVEEAIKDPAVPVTAPETLAPAAARQVEHRVMDEVAPIVQNLTNNEPWYRSRVTWGALVAIALPLLRAIGVNTDLIDQGSVVDIIMSLVAAAGGLYVLYGRYVGKKPLGA